MSTREFKQVRAGPIAAIGPTKTDDQLPAIDDWVTYQYAPHQLVYAYRLIDRDAWQYVLEDRPHADNPAPVPPAVLVGDIMAAGLAADCGAADNRLLAFQCQVDARRHLAALPCLGSRRVVLSQRLYGALPRWRGHNDVV